MHPLRKYRTANNLSSQYVSEQIGISQPQLTRIELGTRRASFEVAKALEAFSNGAVTAEEILSCNLPHGYKVVQDSQAESPQ